MVDPTIDDYLKGKIYKLISNQTNNIYIGSTITKLSIRFANHKNNKNDTTAHEILKYNDVKIILIEEYPTTSKYLLEMRERYWIETSENCVNKVIPTRSAAEYRIKYCEENKEYIKELGQKYYQDHKEDLKATGQKYREKNKEQLKEKGRKYREEHKEKIKKSSKKSYGKNIEKVKKMPKTILHRTHRRNKG